MTPCYKLVTSTQLVNYNPVIQPHYNLKKWTHIQLVAIMQLGWTVHDNIYVDLKTIQRSPISKVWSEISLSHNTKIRLLWKASEILRTDWYLSNLLQEKMFLVDLCVFNIFQGEKREEKRYNFGLMWPWLNIQHMYGTSITIGPDWF